MTFVTPLLLLGLAAAAIPFVLHLLSSVRAQEVYFPTLRFLRSSMEKTARRRRIQHWLLLLLRAALLALLALAVAEPVSRAAGSWLGGREHAAVVVLDNSYSMAARGELTTRFDKAKAEASALLSGNQAPTLGGLVTTDASFASQELTGRLDPLREGVANASIAMDRAPLATRVAEAVELLDASSIPQKSVYLFTDLQRISAEEMYDVRELTEQEDVHLLVVDPAGEGVDNVGIADLEVGGLRVVDQALEITATLVNSSSSDRKVEVGLRINGTEVGHRRRKSLQAVGSEGSSGTVRFYHRFTRPGEVIGEVFLADSDDLALDNTRRFALDISGKVRALIVRGPARAGEPMGLDPAMMLRLALDPFEGSDQPWSIEPRTVESEQLGESDLAGADAAFFCEAPQFSEEQAAAIGRFVAGGGTAVFFLGPDVRIDNYNERFIEQLSAEGGLLPGRLEPAVGEVGPTAEATPVDWVDTSHPYLAGLFEDFADYLAVLVQRYHPLSPSVRPGRTLMRLRNGDPLMIVKRFGQGRSILFTTTASPRWSNLPLTGLFLPVAARISLLAPQRLGRDETYLAGAQVPITLRPGPDAAAEELTVHVTLPGGDAGVGETVSIAAKRTSEGYVATFTDTDMPGVYRWRLADAEPDQAGAGGQFVVNPHGGECRLASIPRDTFVQAMRNQGFGRVYAAADLEGVNAAAAEESQGRNWWDVLLALVILLLVVEAIVANRFRQQREETVPAHLNPKVAAA